jgi:hypothetical protein
MYIYAHKVLNAALGRDKILAESAMLRLSGGHFLRVLLFLPLVIVWCDKGGPSIRIYLCKIEWSVSRISSRNEKPLHSPINMIISK